MEIPVLITAGNHDSVYHLSFLSPLLEARRVYISRPLEQGTELAHVTLRDEHGPVTFWLLPYVYPAMIAQALGAEEIRDYDTAVRRILRVRSRSTRIMEVMAPVGMTMNLPFVLGRLAPHSNSLSSI